MPSDILQVRAPALNFYVLRDAAGLYLLDTGILPNHCDHAGPEEHLRRLRGLVSPGK